MEHIIDIQLVKEQLRLLGHEVEDGVILDFVRGLNKGSAGASQTQEERAAADQDVRPQQPAAAAVDTSSKSKAARAPASVADRDTDAAPSKLQQAPDQQSPKRPLTAAGPQQDSPAVPMPQHAALDQRCRNFLSRCSDTPSAQQEQEQVQHHQQQQPPLQPVLLQVPHVQDSARLPGAAAGSSSPQSGSSSRSSELLLGDAGNDTDSTDSSTRGLGAHTAANWAQPPPQQYQQLAQFGAELDNNSRDSGDDSDSDGSSLVLETEGSKFLLHQAATMQRVRARLAAKMAGYAAAASAQESSGANQLQASASAAAAAAAARLGAGSSGAASSASNSSAADSSSELPRFGFRPGYTSVGIHMPPPPSAAAVEALAAARTLRQQVSTEGGSAAGAPMAAGSSSKAATVPPLKLDLPLNMQSLTSAVNRLHEQQQQQQASRKGHSRIDTLLLPDAVGGVLHPIASPGKAACASSVAAARASASIIGETPPCMASAAAGHKPRQSPRVDPLYLAPSCPRRSSPATPRSSPALSPAPVAAPLSAAAAGPGPLCSPAGAAPAAAVGAGRSGGSASVKQSLTFSAGSRGAAAARGSAHHQHQQQQQRGEAGGAGRRASSAPPTPSAGAPGGALRGPGPGGVGGSSASGGCYSARRSAAVSHESLYCQRLSSACGSQRSTVAPGVRKTDRVARFQQMQQQWARDRFLSSGAGGAAKKSAGQ